MKAKVHAKFLLVALDKKDEEEFNKSVDSVINRFISEYCELLKSRNIRTHEAAYAVLQEINDKWNAVCRQVNKERMILKENGIKALLEKWAEDKPELQMLIKPPISRRKMYENLSRFNRFI